MSQTDGPAEPPARSPSSRPWQFSLRSLLILMTLWALVCPWLNEDVFAAMALFSLVYVVLLVMVVLIREAAATEAHDPESPVLLVSVPSEAEATVIVDFLGHGGIRATAVGGYTAGFRAEAPGWVTVYVARQHLDQAKALLAEVET